MKIVCDCGATTEFTTSEDGELYTEGEGWYKVKNGSVDIWGAHDQVFFKCDECGEEIWIFT